jgi:hypothetical protein
MIDYNEYFAPHPEETHLLKVGKQVFLGSQKTQAESYARVEALQIETVYKEEPKKGKSKKGKTVEVEQAEEDDEVELGEAEEVNQ